MNKTDQEQAPIRILVVDDEPSICTFIRQLLTTHDYQVEVAHDCASALILLKEETFQFVLTDLTLPDAGGYSILDQARQDNPNVIAIVMSGYNIESYSTLSQHKVDDYITKPFSIDELLYVVDKHKKHVLMQDEIRALEESLAAEQRKGTFFENAGHQLKTPIAVLKEFIILFKEGFGGTLTDKQEQYLRAIDDNIDRLLVLVENVENLSRAKEGSWIIRLEEESPVEILEPAIVSWQTFLARRNLTFSLDLAENLPKIKVDKWAVDQIIFNLLDNAAKYSPKKGKISLRCYQKQDDFVCFEVSDEGQGIPEDMHLTVFEPFVRLPEHDTTPGLGLGLTIAQELAKHMGGRLQLEKTEDNGAKFLLSLPTA